MSFKLYLTNQKNQPIKMLTKVLLLLSIIFVVKAVPCASTGATFALDLESFSGDPCPPEDTCKLVCPCGQTIYIDLRPYVYAQWPQAESYFHTNCQKQTLKTWADESVNKAKMEVYRGGKSSEIYYFEKTMHDMIQNIVTKYNEVCKGKGLNPEVEREILLTEYKKLISEGKAFGSESQLRTSMVYQELITKLTTGAFEFCPCSILSGAFNKGKIPIKLTKNLEKTCGEACNSQTTILNYVEDE
jgi:hypothetical protein